MRQLERLLGQFAGKWPPVGRRRTGRRRLARDLRSSWSRAVLSERAREKLPPGVATGLAWTETGGEVLYIEAALFPADAI